MATLGAFLLAVLVVLSMSGAYSRPTHDDRLAGMTQTLLDGAEDLYDDYCDEVHKDLSVPSGLAAWERCESVANEYRAWCNVPQLTTLSQQDTRHHQHRVMYRTLCKYDKLRSSLLEDVCEGPVRDSCSRRSPVCEAEGQSHTCSPQWRSESCLCVRVSHHSLTHQLVTNLTSEASITCSGIEQPFRPMTEQYEVRGCMLAFLHGLKQQVEEFKDILSPSE